jgi:RNA polymerase-binding transcription factor DksA
VAASRDSNADDEHDDERLLARPVARTCINCASAG